MAKVTINGEVFGWDPVHRPMSEALAIEHALKTPYAEYERGLEAGSARSIAGFIWLVWRRNGRDVPLDDILAGKVDIDLATLNIEPEEGEGEEGEGEAGPTRPTPTPSSTTGGSTSASSPKSSTSARGRSGSSPRTSSKP